MKHAFKKRTLVTGGAGFIGSHYLNYAVKKYPNELFINVDALTYAARLENVRVSERKNYVFEKADICDVGAMSALFEKYEPTGIVHFAAESHVDQSIVDPSMCLKTNVEGTHVLLKLARDSGIERFHLISTDEVYGGLTLEDTPRTEESPYNPGNPYSASKAAAELLARSYHHTYGLPLVITRSSNNYGPHQDRSKLIPKFISKLLSGERVPLYAQGTNVRDWLFVEDNVRAIDLVFRKGRDGEIYNIGGGHELTNIAVTHILLKALKKGEEHIEHVKDRPGHDLRYSLSSSKIARSLGWKPRTDFASGIKKTVQYYKKESA